MRTLLFELYDNFDAYAASAAPAGGNLLATLKAVSVVVSLFFLGIVIYSILKLRKGIGQSLERVEESISAPDLPKKMMDRRWESILEKLEPDDGSSWKLAVIEADKILDDILKRIGYQGEDMGERLKQITPAQLSNIEEIWQAHKMRNNIVHHPDFEIKKAQARRAIEIYRRALEDLEAL